MSEFKVDFFELMFLAEACIPPRPIARAMFWENLINKYYHQMTNGERDRAFEWLTKMDAFNKEDADCRLFFARFNPQNQYLVETEFEGKKDTVECFLFDEKYHTAKNTYVDNRYVIKATLKERISLP